MDAGGLMQGASLLSRPAEEFENDLSVEAMWATKAFEYAEIHFNILCSLEPKYLNLTQHDEQIYRLFRQDFPTMSVGVVNEDEMKSNIGKTKWREFFEKLKGKIEDAAFGTLLRIDASGEYSQENTTLTPRMQFLTIEIARNREGFNDTLRKIFRPLPKSEETEKAS